MTESESRSSDLLVRLPALATALENAGQYNLAKLARAAAESMSRQAAHATLVPSARDKLALEVEHAADALSRLGAAAEVAAALRRGAAAMAEGRLPLYDVAPNPFVCRTCGYITLRPPTEQCPSCGAWPASFLRFLPVYWLDAMEPFDALARMRQTPTDVAALLEGLPEEAMHQAPEGAWSMHHVVTHLRDAQGVLAARVKLLIEQENPSLESKAVFEWAAAESADRPTTQEILAAYAASRRETVSLLEGIPLRDWWCTGRHEEFGTVTLRQQVSYFTAHEVTHLPQIEALRRQVAGRM